MTDAADTTEAPVTFEKGTWQDSLNKSSTLKDRAGKANKQAGNLLWTGAKKGIEQWFPTSATDAQAEAFQTQVLAALGASRKGDASKIKTVALAVRNHALVLDDFPNLSKAYAKAVDLTKGEAERVSQDAAADEVIESLEAPKTASTPAAAALILLSRGLDGAVVAILDALNGVATDAEGKTLNNEAAHRAFMRAVSTEIASRVQAAKPKPEPKPKAEVKAGASKAKTGTAKKAAAPAPAATKGKPKGRPAKKAAAPVASTEDGVVDDDLFDEIEGDEPVATEPVKKAVAKKGTPVKRPARPRAASANA